MPENLSKLLMKWMAMDNLDQLELEELYYIYLTKTNTPIWTDMHGRGYKVNFERMLIEESKSGELRQVKRANNKLYKSTILRMADYQKGCMQDHELTI